jgi:hypothetical protein
MESGGGRRRGHWATWPLGHRATGPLGHWPAAPETGNRKSGIRKSEIGNRKSEIGNPPSGSGRSSSIIAIVQNEPVIILEIGVCVKVDVRGMLAFRAPFPGWPGVAGGGRRVQRDRPLNRKYSISSWPNWMCRSAWLALHSLKGRCSTGCMCLPHKAKGTGVGSCLRVATAV